MPNGFRARVLVAEDEAVTTVADAIAQVGRFDPHAVNTNFNFGDIGRSRADETKHPLPYYETPKLEVERQYSTLLLQLK